MSLKISHSLKQTQSLTMTPQLRQAIKMLTMNALELSEHLSQEIIENPMLEEGHLEENTSEATQYEGEELKKVDELPENHEWEEYLQAFGSLSQGDVKDLSVYHEDDPAFNFENLLSAQGEESLKEHLSLQIVAKSLSLAQEGFALYLIGNLDENGHFLKNSRELFKEFSSFVDPEQNLSQREKLEVLEILQHLDPLGLAVNNWQESLLVQANYYFPDDELLQRLIKEELLELEQEENYPQMAKRLGIDLNHLRELISSLKELSPLPAKCYQEEKVNYIVPDLILRKTDDQLILELSQENLRRPQISSLGKSFLRNKNKSEFSSPEVKQYVTEKIKSAMWLLKSLGNRQSTLLRVGECILKKQEDFFLKGPKYLRPMILKDVAFELGLHESTISRVTTNKYIQTYRGTFELKYFFSTGIGKNALSEGVTSRFLQEKIREYISSEDTKRPLSDQKISNLLQCDKIKIARRTVTKYRELMNIKPAAQRKACQRNSIGQ